jgi:DNA-binding NarL/FixJ family response regulator/putative methionine-R-sulfoxide reductase with GAF domain
LGYNQRVSADFPQPIPATGEKSQVEDPAWLPALSAVNMIAATLSRLAAQAAAAGDLLRLVVEGATRILPGASAVVYAYEPGHGRFAPGSRLSAPAGLSGTAGRVGEVDLPRPDGLGQRALARRRPVVSYEEPDLAIHPARWRAGARVAVCLPIVSDDLPLAALYLFLHDDRRLTVAERLLLENYAHLAGMALGQVGRMNGALRDLARREDELSLLRQAGLLISTRAGLDETLATILPLALEITGARYGIFRLLDEAGKNLVTAAVAGESLRSPAIEALPLNATSVMGYAARTRQPVNITDVRQPPWSRIYYPLDHNLEMRSELAVPLIGAGGRLEGVLNLESPEIGAFSAGDSRLLQSLATQAVIAIQEARLLEALRAMSQRRSAGESGVPAPSSSDILLIAADAAWRSHLTEWLEWANRRVRPCADAGEASAVMRRERCHLLVLDPEPADPTAPGGERAVDLALREAAAAGTPVILVSRRMTAQDLERLYVEFDVFAYLAGPGLDREGLSAAVVQADSAGVAPRGAIARLTPRERDVLALVVHGLPNKGIARALVISENTVKRYLKSIFEKLEVASRAAAAARAVQAGLG